MSEFLHHHHHPAHPEHAHGEPPEHEVEGKARDPVCGMTVDPLTTPHHAEQAGRAFHFCSAGCRAKFVADPAKYLNQDEAAPPAPEGTIYTCPMHPQVRQVGPGACPICGMA